MPLDDLRAVRISYVGFDPQTHAGTVVVHKRFAQTVKSIFSDLFNARFPIHKIDLCDDYGSKYAENDITVGFYCRKADDAPSEWSSHAYGMAIDVNPLENPYRNTEGAWWPENAAKYGPRDGAIGKMTTNSTAFAIFAPHGRYGGGFYVGERDYMHFNVYTIGGKEIRWNDLTLLTHCNTCPAARMKLRDSNFSRSTEIGVSALPMCASASVPRAWSS